MALKEKEDIRLFDRLAAQYDRFNHLSSLGIDRLWRRQAVALLPSVKSPSPSGESEGAVLDVAVGTADLAIAILQSGKAHHVEGIDLSTEMMRIGRYKAERAGLAERLTFTEGSALAMPYPDASFDVVTCAYGIRNFSDLDRGLREFRRVLRPGGQLIILEFSCPKNPIIAALYTFYFKYVMTTLGTLLTGGDRASFRYFYASVKNFIWGDDFLSHLRAAGFQDAAFKTQTFGISTIYQANR